MSAPPHAAQPDPDRESSVERRLPSARTADSPHLIDRLSHWGFFAGTVILCCQLGMLCAALDWAPYQMTERALLAIRALADQLAIRGQPYDPYLWDHRSRDARGVTRHNARRAFPGYTLYGSGDTSTVRLIDMHGEEVHRWESSYHNVWSDAEHVDGWLSDDQVYIRRARVFPNGDLLALYETSATTPNGIGLAKFDRESRLLWRFDKHAHHDMDVAEDGTIYVLTHEINSDEDPQTLAPDVPFIEDTLSVVSSDGREIKTFSLHRVFAESAYCRPKTMHFYRNGDFLHSNTVDVVDDRFAAHYEAVMPGDVMVCLRNLNLVVVVNPESEEIVWGTTGPWHHPHDPDPLADGNFLIFDNYFVRGSTVGSRVIEFDPRTGEIAWEFAANRHRAFQSDVRACQQRLPNDNILITESDRGRLLEVTPGGRTVWEYVNPIAGGEDQDLVPIIVGGTRVAPEQVPFITN